MDGIKKQLTALTLNGLLLIVLGLALWVNFFFKGWGERGIVLQVTAILGTIPVVVSAIKALVKRKVSMDLLASIALVVSLAEGEWGSAVFINLMMTSARIFGEYTTGKAKAAIKGLLKLRPQKVKVEREGRIVEEPMSRVKVNDRVVIEAGDRIPVDGVVLNGEASVDQSSLTGESMPVSIVKGDRVFGATLNVSGSLVVKAEKVGKDTTFEKVVSLVIEAHSGKSDIQTAADKFASWYILVTIGGAITLFLLTRNLTLMLSVLLVTCADDIAVAVPMAFWAGIGQAAKRGIVIKGGKFLEGLAEVKTLVVDKTGTLTAGKASLEKIVIFGKEKEMRVLRLAAIAESVSEHPIAKAVMEYARARQMDVEVPDNFEESPGKGVLVDYQKGKLVVGNVRFLKEQKVKMNEAELQQVDGLDEKGLTVVAVGYMGKLLGCVVLTDELRAGVKESLMQLGRLGVKRVMMLTGDNERVAERVAKELGISDYRANLLPEEKLEIVKEQLNPREKLVMVGDGVNDAASLAAADIGMAMGTIGSDAAIEAADVALMQNNFNKVAEAVALGRFTAGIARQDLWLWGGINAIGLVLVLGKILGPSGAAAFNFVTDFLPLLNSLRVFNYRRVLECEE